MNRYFIILIIVICSFYDTKAQNDSIIQFTGIVTNDSLEPLPFTHIVLLTKNQGTISNFNGFFSFVVERTDTVLFSTIGYKHKLFAFSDTMKTDDIFVNIKMERDTIMIAEIHVFPYATFEQFKHAFLTIEIPDDDLERAKKNIEIINIFLFSRKLLRVLVLMFCMMYRKFLGKNQASSRILNASLLCSSIRVPKSTVTTCPSLTTYLPPTTVKSDFTGAQKTRAATGSCSAPA